MTPPTTVGTYTVVATFPGTTDYASAKRSDTARYARFFHAMRARGVYFAPSQFEAAFVSLAHTETDLDSTVKAAADALSG